MADWLCGMSGVVGESSEVAATHQGAAKSQARESGAADVPAGAGACCESR